MPSCAFRKCSNNSRNSNKAKGVTFHIFPEDPVMREKWTRIIQAEQKDNKWLPTKHSRICSAHFNEDMFHTTATGRRKIKDFAVPYFRMSSNESTYEMIGSPLEIVYDSDNGSVFDSPRTIHLKRQLKKEIGIKMRYRCLLQSEKRKTRRFKLRIAHLKEIVRKLRGNQNVKKIHKGEGEQGGKNIVIMQNSPLQNLPTI